MEKMDKMEKMEKKEKIKRNWVQDTEIIVAPSVIMSLTEKNAGYIHNTGSRYVTGPPKNGNTDYVGIYFEDPTSSETKNKK